MGLDFHYIHGQTPLDEDEKEGLRIPTISTRKELDEFEQKNIEDAVQWTLGQKMKSADILTEKFVKTLHSKMFGDVWKWAGQFRKTDKNLGIDKWQIPMALKELLDNSQLWIEKEIFSPDEIAIRIKHKIVSIHCFPNGNGRHSRLMADIISSKVYERPVFTWASKDLIEQSLNRNSYIKALRAADDNDYEPLLSLARS